MFKRGCAESVILPLYSLF